MSLERSRSQDVQQVTPAVNAGSMPPAPSSAMGDGTEQPYFRLDIRRALELHRKLALSLAVTGLLAAAAYAAVSWPVYTAESQIYVQPTSDKIMDQGNNRNRWPYDSNTYDSYIQQQAQLASNPDVLEDAVHKLPAGSWKKAGESDRAAAERLGQSIKVERQGSSYQVGITAQSKSAEMAAQIANAVASSIVEKAVHEENAGDAERLTILKSERDRVQNQLNADLAEQDALNQQLGMAAVGTEAPDLIDNAIGATREELIKARTDHDEAEARFASLDAKDSKSSAALNAEADELVASDPGLASMKTSLNQRLAILVTQMANLTPNNPEYKLDARELAQINASQNAMMKDLRAKAAERIQERLRTDLERTAGVEARLNGQLRQLAETAASATPRLQRASDLASDVIRLRNRYAAVDEELHDIVLQDSVPGAVHLSVAAAPPLHPAYGGVLRRTAPLALGGLLLGLLAALLANHLDAKVYIGSDVQHLLGFAPMIALPDYGEVPDAVFEEHILRLSTAIEHARKQGSLRHCIFTGTGMGAGVTTVVTRVRDMLASMGRPTVLVDAAATAHTARPRSGEENRFDGAAQPANERGTRSLALLERVTAETGTQDESLVLSDTAPLLISAETEYLSRFVDCVILVAESGVTTRAELRAAAGAMQRLNIPAVGLVLNRVSLTKADAAFRRSVRGIEAHVRMQSRATPRPAPRSRDFEKDVHAPSFERELHNPAARPKAIAGRRDVSNPETVANPLAAANAEPREAKAAIVRLAQPAAERPFVECPAGRVAAESRTEAPVPQFTPQSAPRASALSAMEKPSASEARAAQEWAASAPAPETDEPWWLSETPLTATVTNGRILADGAPENQEPALQPDVFEDAGLPVSRLSGLRSALFGAGARSAEWRDAERREEPRYEEPAQPQARSAAPEPFAASTLELEPLAAGVCARGPYAAQPYLPEPYVPEASEPVFAPAHMPDPESVSTETSGEHDALRVVAAPEFLPPQAGRLDRRDALDDIAVLPSRRGQYRRKS